MTLSERRTRRAIWIGVVAVTAVFLVSLLIGPRAPVELDARGCFVNLVGPKPFGISLNCDSIALLQLAQYPNRLLDKGSFRQSRPGMVIPAFLLRPLFLPFQKAPEWLGIHRADKMHEYFQRFVPEMLANGLPSFLAYATFNVLLLWLTFWLYLRIVKVPIDATPATLIAVTSVGYLLVANDIVKVFFWSPHVQLYNIIAPLLATLVAAEKLAGATTVRYAVLVGALSGLGMTAYPLFVIVPVCLAIAAAVAWAVNRIDLRTAATDTAAVLAATTIPPLAWFGFVMLKVGSFYSGELAFGQLIWIGKSLAEGKFIATAFNTIVVGYIGPLLVQLSALAAPTAILIYLNRGLSKEAMTTVCGALIAAVVTFAFYATTGVPYWRTAFAVLPPLIVMLGMMCREVVPQARNQALLASILLAIAIQQTLYTAIKHGPYS